MSHSSSRKLRWPLLAAGAAALVFFTTSALAGSGVGGVFNLGQTNTVNATSTLTGTSSGPQLKVVNASTASNSIQAQAGGGGGIALYGQHTTTAGAGPALRADSASTAVNAFSIYGVLSSSTPGAASAAVRGLNYGTGTNGYGVWGTQLGQGTGVYGTASTGAGIGVFGRHLGSSGAGPGVEGQSASLAGAGVLGVNSGGGPGLSAVVNAGVAPLAVNSTTKVANLNADLLDGHDSSAFAQYKRTVIVSPVGTQAQNGTALVNALAAVTTASVTNPFLLKIEPGIYQVSSPLQMKPYVDIEGSGEGVTTIEGAYGDNGTNDQSVGAVVWTAANAELRDLTVENLGDVSNPTFTIGLYVDSSGRVNEVAAISSASSGTNAYGVFVNSSAAASLDRLTASAQGGSSDNAGLATYSSNLSLVDSTLAGSGGSYAYGFLGETNANSGSFAITRSTLTASGGSLLNEALHTDSATVVRASTLSSPPHSGATVHAGTKPVDVALSQLAGGAVTGTVTCAGVYDENFTFYASTCP